uniref:Rho GTPase-activating protein 6-like n=1 Tax=Erpetoichthys calabaricus TaxID=27687 RepID=A0A8C4SDQ7_ERPCA
MDPKPHLSSMLLRLFTIHRSIIVKKGSFSMLGQSFKFEPVFIQDLSELERDRLQEIAFFHLREKGFSNNLLISKDSPKRELNLRMRLDALYKEKKEKGLQTVGIFRLGSSKKRVRQLRDDFDQGKDVILDEEQSIHDVAALLKEFLRDMPDPLLPSELYSAFLSTSEIHKGEQISFLQLLIFLLPPCNCDTLYRILQFLNKVASHSEDICGPDNQEICGNKMTAANLATVFGPNLLQREKTTGKDLTPYVTEVEDSAKIILVVQILIENYDLLFTVSPELQQEVLESLIQTDPDVIQYLIRRKHKSHLLN